MSDTLLSIPFKLRFVGKDADEHRVASYTGSQAVYGFTRSLQIASQAYLNQVAVSKATALRDADLFLMSAKPSSLTFDFRLDIFKCKAGVTLNPQTFFDFCSTVFYRASGRQYLPKTAYVKKLDEDKEDDLIDLTIEQLEEPLKDAHSAIGNSIEGMYFDRPRSGPQVYFDNETKSYMQISQLSDVVKAQNAHITRFNSITGNGRAYINSLSRVVPFSLDRDFLSSKRGFITWSLHGSNVHRSKNLILDVLEVTSAKGTVKRLSLVDCNRLGDD